MKHTFLEKQFGTSQMHFQNFLILLNNSSHKDLKRIEKLFKIVNYLNLFDMQDLDNNLLNQMELENLKMKIIDLQSNPIQVEKFVNMRKHIQNGMLSIIT